MGRKQTQSKSQGQRQQTRQGLSSAASTLELPGVLLENNLHFEIGSAASQGAVRAENTDPHRLGKAELTH